MYYTKIKKEIILQTFDLCENSIVFDDKGMYSFENSSYKAFKSLNSYLEKGEQ